MFKIILKWKKWRHGFYYYFMIFLKIIVSNMEEIQSPSKAQHENEAAQIAAMEAISIG